MYCCELLHDGTYVEAMRRNWYKVWVISVFRPAVALLLFLMPWQRFNLKLDFLALYKLNIIYYN